MLGQTHTQEELQEILQEAIYHLGKTLYAEGRTMTAPLAC